MPNRHVPWALRRLAVGVVLGASLFLGCASTARWPHLGEEREVQEAYKRYTQLIRWQEFERASRYLDPDQRAAFLAQAHALGDIRFTDYEVVSEEFDEAEARATVRVTYRAYRPASMIEIRLDESQEWTRESSTGHWRVRQQLVEEHARIGPGGR